MSLRGAHVIDVGFGDRADTSIELAGALGPLGARVTAVEPVAAWVSSAREAAAGLAPNLAFAVGDFSLAQVAPMGTVALVRVANVLRSYPEPEVAEALAAMAPVLVDGGVLLDVTCDRDGTVGTALLWRGKDAQLAREALLFFTDFQRGFAPPLFRDVLPRIYRRRVFPGSGIWSLLTSWQEVWGRYRTPDPRAAFAASVRHHPALEAIGPGFAVWTPPGGLPEP